MNGKTDMTVNDLLESCMGCGACEQLCPQNAIRLILNNNGFFEPQINGEKCVDCGFCFNRCTKNVFVLRLKGSSGGIYPAVATFFHDNGWIICGAVFEDDYKGVALSDTNFVEINRLFKSKYVVCNPNKEYIRIKEYLEDNKNVLFCSTPCQVSGLKRFLGKEYDNLVTLDFVCGGTPSLSFYLEHKMYLENKFRSKIKSIDFRPKEKGWGKQRIKIVFENDKKYFVRSFRDTYFNCFVEKHLSVRCACVDCKYRENHLSDITLADFWAYKNAHVAFDKKGLSLVIANTVTGKEILTKCDDFLNLIELDESYVKYAYTKEKNTSQQIIEIKEFFDLANKIGFEEASKKIY